MARLAGQPAEVCKEIDQLVSRITEAVAQLAPLPLLLLAYREYLYHNADLSSETEAGDSKSKFTLVTALSTSDLLAERLKTVEIVAVVEGPPGAHARAPRVQPPPGGVELAVLFLFGRPVG